MYVEGDKILEGRGVLLCSRRNKTMMKIYTIICNINHVSELMENGTTIGVLDSLHTIVVVLRILHMKIYK